MNEAHLLLSGVAFADKVIVQSEEIRMTIEECTLNYGKNTFRLYSNIVQIYQEMGEPEMIQNVETL